MSLLLFIPLSIFSATPEFIFEPDCEDNTSWSGGAGDGLRPGERRAGPASRGLQQRRPGAAN